MVREARSLEIVQKPSPRKNRPISEEDVNIILGYYDDNSDNLAERKQSIKVKDKYGVSQRVGKKLLNLTIDGVFSLYKRDRLAMGKKPISKSKFFKLRPKHIITADASGTHYMCVCIYHQNVELMIESLQIPKGREKYWYLKSITCDDPSVACALDKCDKCLATNNYVWN